MRRKEAERRRTTSAELSTSANPARPLSLPANNTERAECAGADEARWRFAWKSAKSVSSSACPVSNRPPVTRLLFGLPLELGALPPTPPPSASVPFVPNPSSSERFCTWRRTGTGSSSSSENGKRHSPGEAERRAASDEAERLSRLGGSGGILLALCARLSGTENSEMSAHLTFRSSDNRDLRARQAPDASHYSTKKYICRGVLFQKLCLSTTP